MKRTMLALAALLFPSVARAEATDQQAVYRGNTACSRVAMKITDGFTDPGDPPWAELMRRCEHDALGGVCRAATDAIVEKGKASPLHCPPE